MESIVWELRGYLLDIADRCDDREEARRIRELLNKFCYESSRIVEEREVVAHVFDCVDVCQIWHDVDEETGQPLTSSKRAFIPRQHFEEEWVLDPFCPRLRRQLRGDGVERLQDYTPSPFTGLIKVQVRLEGETEWELFDSRERPFGKALSAYASREDAERESSRLNREYLESLPKGRRWRAKSPFGVRPKDWDLVTGEGGIFYLPSEKMTSFQEEAQALLEKYGERR